MTPCLYFPILFFTCTLLVWAAGAKAEIVQCVGATGALTYTNVSCPGGSRMARAVAASQPAPAEGADGTPDGTVVADGADLHRAWLNHGAIGGSARSAGPDVATLKAAKSAMLSMDRAALMSRQVKLARLN